MPPASFGRVDETLRNCPVCGAETFAPHLEKAGMRLVRCGACGMIYVRSVPAEYASGEYYDLAGNSYYLTPSKLESDYSPVRFERELRVFRRHCPAGRVLDVGCSSGAFLFQLRQQFGDAYEVLGTDVSGPALDYAEQRGVPVLRGDFLKQSFAAPFDAVCFWAVLEHVTAPREFLAKAAAALRPGGVCFVLVPNFGSLATRFLGARYRYIYPQHLNYFTRATLLRLAGNAFAAIETRTTHFNPVVIYQDWRNAGREVSNAERAELLRRTTAYKRNRWLKPVKWGYQGAEAVLGRLGLADNLLTVLRKL